MPSDDWSMRLDLAGDVETPVMVTDLSAIRRNCRRFREALPGVGLFYALKAYSDPAVARAALPEVDGFDVASPAEVDLLLGLGVDPARLVYSNPVKPESAITAARAKGVGMFAFQSAGELAKLARSAPGSRVYARVRLTDGLSTVPFGSGKWGCAPEETVALLREARSLGLRPIGLTFHVGSQQTRPEAWTAALAGAHGLIDDARAAGLAGVGMVNLGGGLPARYTRADPPLARVGEAIGAALRHGEREGISYIAEPGRFLVADSSAIVASVIGVERRGGTSWAFLDAGFFQTFLESRIFDVFPFAPRALRAEAEPVPFDLAGPSCDSDDVICRGALLPADLATGDRVLFPNAGAYTVVYGSAFNGFAVPPRVVVDSGREGAAVNALARA